MPTQDDFLPFAVSGGANVVSQAVYAALPAIANGYSSGIATSAQLNKTWRQSSIMAAVIAQFIIQEVNQPVIDDGTTTTILANLTAAIQALATATANSNVTITTTGGSTTLNSTQYAAGFIFVTGVLVSNATLIFPAQDGKWVVVNNTTGAHTLTCRTSLGTGVVVTQARGDSIFSDGTDIRFSQIDTVTQDPGDNSSAQASTAFVTQAVGDAVGFTYLTGNTLITRSGHYLLDTSAGGFTVTLPLTPSQGFNCTFTDARATWTANNVEVDLNGSDLTMNGAAYTGSLNCNVADQEFTIWYDGTTWRLV